MGKIAPNDAQEQWQRGPATLPPIDRQRIDYTLATWIQDLEDCLQMDEPADLVINQALGEFIQCYYRLAGGCPAPKIG